MDELFYVDTAMIHIYSLIASVNNLQRTLQITIYHLWKMCSLSIIWPLIDYH